MTDESCRAFDSAEGLDANSLNRFVLGADPVPRRMAPAEVKALGDAFTQTFFAKKGNVPRSAERVVLGIKAAAPKKSPLRIQKSFILGEGSQIAMSGSTAKVERGLRFVVTLGEGQNGPDILVSAFDPGQPDQIEVMAWDHRAQGFNFYRSMGSRAMWMLAGNSRDALHDSSRGKGPFESHPSGSLLMKELKTPWNNWHSPDANISANVFAANDPRRKHEWFTKKEPGGALSFEEGGARPAIERWGRARFAAFRDGNGTVTRPRHVMEQVLGTPNPRHATVNLTSTHVESAALRPSDQLDLPLTFFVDTEGLSGVLGLNSPPFFTVSGRIYAKCLDKFNVRLEEGSFARKGDTHFCFLVPERSFEDQVALRHAIEIGLLSKRLAVCLLMVDPWNPVFSNRRSALLRHTPPTARIAKGKSNFSREMVAAILAAAAAGPPGTPEAEFAQRWKAGPKFTAKFNKLLGAYYKAVTAKLKTQAGFDPYFRLAEARRQTFRKMPISEFELLLPMTSIEPAPRRMLSDGRVEEG